MAGIFEVLLVFVTAVTPLLRSNHGFISISQLSRRARINDDKLRRSIAKLAEYMNDPLISLDGRRLVLTDVGKNCLERAGHLLALGKERADDDLIEKVKVGIVGGIDPLILMVAISAWLLEWQGLASLQIRQVAPDQLAEESVAIGWVHMIGNEPNEEVASLPLKLLVPHQHLLAESSEELDLLELSESERVFLSPSATGASLGSVLCKIPEVNRIEVGSSEAVRLLVQQGAGLGLDFTLAGSSDRLVARTVAGVEPGVLGLYLGEGFGQKEQVKSLIERVRNAATPKVEEALVS